VLSSEGLLSSEAETHKQNDGMGSLLPSVDRPCVAGKAEGVHRAKPGSACACGPGKGKGNWQAPLSVKLSCPFTTARRGA
jgi:hypothetical protein